MSKLLLAVCLLSIPLIAQNEAPILDAGEHRYRWVDSWGKLPDGQRLGNTHGCMVVDGKGRLYVNTDTERAVMVFAPTGELVDSWGAEFKGGLHGMTIRKEGDQEFLYLAHTHRGEVVKTTLDGKVLWRIGWPEESGQYEKKGQYRPTGVTLTPDGSIWIVDGYGKSLVHHYGPDRKYRKTIGGRGKEPGKFRTPHGIFLDTRKDTPRLVVSDRENHRLQILDLEGKVLEVVEGMFRRPCNVYQHGQDLVVADLAGRITLIDGKNELIAQLGDQPDPKKRARNGIPMDQWLPGEFLAPHSACFDAAGNIYVMDWVSAGRVTKLERMR